MFSARRAPRRYSGLRHRSPNRDRRCAARRVTCRPNSPAADHAVRHLRRSGRSDGRLTPRSDVANSGCRARRPGSAGIRIMFASNRPDIDAGCGREAAPVPRARALVHLVEVADQAHGPRFVVRGALGRHADADASCAAAAWLPRWRSRSCTSFGHCRGAGCSSSLRALEKRAGLGDAHEHSQGQAAGPRLFIHVK